MYYKLIGGEEKKKNEGEQNETDAHKKKSELRWKNFDERQSTPKKNCMCT